jgi:hypothetical protein
VPVNPDFLDLLRELGAADARFLVVGGYAVSFHARPRATGDLDLWVEPAAGNAPRVLAALRAFGAPLEHLSEADLTAADTVYQMGLPPRRIDLLTSLTGVSFGEAWAGRVLLELEGVRIPFIGKDALIRNKRALGRPRDLADLEALEDPS